MGLFAQYAQKKFKKKSKRQFSFPLMFLPFGLFFNNIGFYLRS